MSAKHTPGPWRWELNEKHRNLHLVGGVPQFDLTIMDFERWGMQGATVRLRDTAHGGMNIMHKLHERRDWIAPFSGRKHHSDWCLDVIHPDMRLIAAAPELLKVLRMARAKIAADLQVMAMCHTGPDGLIDDAEVVLLIEAEQDLLNQIDAAVAQAGGAA